MTESLSPTARLEAALGAAREALPGAGEVSALRDEALVEAQRLLAVGQADVQRAAAVVAAEIARRSRHDQGSLGLAQRAGFTTPERFVQSLTGTPLSEARRLVSVGELVSATVGEIRDSAPTGVDSAVTPGSSMRWDAAIGTAVASGALTLAQAEAMRDGFAEAARDSRLHELVRGALDRLLVRAIRFSFTVEELRREARLAASLVSAELIAEREARQRDARSLRWFRRADGMTQYSLLADPASSALIDASLAAALAPRRGGVRFVDPARQEAADEVRADERTYEQHAFDILLGILKTGIDADPRAVFTTASPEVHIVVTARELRGAAQAEAAHNSGDGAGRLTGAGIAHLAGHPEPVTARSVLRHLCTGAFRVITVNERGRPLDVGRAHRTYTPQQRIALAIRDGGCLMPGCERPPSHCEAHHIKPWSEGGGTDLDDGVLLCPGHHLNLHNTGSRIERVDPSSTGAPVYRRIDGATGEITELRSKSAIQRELARGA